jgi:hypothetical protein
VPLPFWGERDAAEHLGEPGRAHRAEALPGPRGAVAAGESVISTSLFGSAPWSPPPLTVEVMAQIVTEPSRLTWPVMFRSPSVAGAYGLAVAALVPVGYPATV